MYIVFHDTDMDGIGAAAAFALKARSEDTSIQFRPTTYQREKFRERFLATMNPLKDSNADIRVVFVDYTPDDFILACLTTGMQAGEIDEVIILDHHRTSKHDLLKFFHLDGAQNGDQVTLDGVTYTWETLVRPFAVKGQDEPIYLTDSLLSAPNFTVVPECDNMSAALIAYDYCFPKAKARLNHLDVLTGNADRYDNIFGLISDRDTWQKIDPRTVPVHEGLSVIFETEGLSTFEQRIDYLVRLHTRLSSAERLDTMLDPTDELHAISGPDFLNPIKEAGLHAIAYRDNIFRDMDRNIQFFRTEFGLVAINQCPYLIASEYAQHVEGSYSIDYVLLVLGQDYAEGKVYCTLRSNSGHVDVSEFARKHGGGGHKAAAGCTMAIHAFADLTKTPYDKDLVGKK